MTIHKRTVTDEDRQPVAVQIDYADWLEIERRLDLGPAAPEAKTPEERKDLDALLDASKGIWKGGDGLEYQRRIREEWTRPWDPEAQNDESEAI